MRIFGGARPITGEKPNFDLCLFHFLLDDLKPIVDDSNSAQIKFAIK